MLAAVSCRKPYKHMDPRKLNSVTRSILATANRLERFANSHIFKPIGLTSAIVQILYIINKQGSTTLTKLVQVLGRTKSNMTQRINLLENKGFVARSGRDSGDARKNRIILTPKGKQVYQKAINRLRVSALDIDSLFSEQELSDHLDFMAKLNAKLDECKIPAIKLKK